MTTRITSLAELIGTSIRGRGFEWEPREPPDGLILCGVVRRSGHAATVAISGLEAMANNDTGRMLDLVIAKIGLAERTIAALEENTGGAGQTAKAAESKGDDAPLAPKVSATEAQ
jgi:hypothetical protein